MRSLLLLLLFFAVGTPCARADEAEALDLVEEADEALEEEAYAAAEALYRRALEAMELCLPARYGLGEALAEQEKTQEALVAFRMVIRDTAARADVPSAWEKYAVRARRYLTKHDENGNTLEAAVDVHVADLVRLAAKHKRGDPDLADRILDRVLLLRPAHKRALEVRGAMSTKGARKEQVFDGKQVKDWDGGRAKWWSVEDGIIVGEAKGIATYIRTQKQIEGNFDVIMEARIAKAGGDVPFLALMGAWTAEFEHSRFGVFTDALTWSEYKGEDNKDQVFRKPVKSLRKPFDPKAWTVYELRYREKYIHAVVNGREVHKLLRPTSRAGGYVGILAQHCRVEIRRVEVLHR